MRANQRSVGARILLVLAILWGAVVLCGITMNIITEGPPSDPRLENGAGND
jgi:hypothetical protein